jgi:Nitrate reductase gamma subunit
MNLFNNFFFIALPYLALFVFLIGSIYRYKSKKFTYSSLSSQFLETRKLYWGSLPFHWGIVFLFFGHLIAFAIPRSVLLWNQQPVRLAILENYSFCFWYHDIVGAHQFYFIEELLIRAFGW